MTNVSKPIVEVLRRSYHEVLCAKVLCRRGEARPYSNADVGSKTSVAIAENLAAQLDFPKCSSPPSPQTEGKVFADCTRDFLQSAFGRLQHLRPGTWLFLTGQGDKGIMDFDQYEHLASLDKVLQKDAELRSMWPADYLVKPDIIMARLPLDDVTIDANTPLIGNSPVARHTPLRASNHHERPFRILHASISCKWTIRSDRAQNVRTEALNLFRNRKGKSPQIVVVTMEPLPSRLASVARGMGDIDCTYHAALFELQNAVQGGDRESEILADLVNGRRLRDISDLPFDLAL